jgi:hypothetical protein
MRLDPDVRRYRKEKARKVKRDAKVIAQAKAVYEAMCKAHRLQPLTTSGSESRPMKVCACGATCWKGRCRDCWKASPETKTRTFTKNRRITKRAA